MSKNGSPLESDRSRHASAHHEEPDVPAPRVSLARHDGRDASPLQQHAIGSAGCVYFVQTNRFAALDTCIGILNDGIVFTADPDGSLRMENHCAQVDCRVNGEAVARGACRRLDHGDVIAVATAELTIQGGARSCGQPASQPPPVDLIALGNALPRSEPAHFSDLAELANLPAAPPPYGSASAGVAAPLVILDEEALSDPAPPVADSTDIDPLAHLLTEYRHALIHHERSYAHELKSIERPQIAAPVPDDPFLDAPGRYRRGSLLGDLLGNRQNIDYVLDEMNPFCAEALFAEEERHDVLLLLAPLRRKKAHFPQTALLARHEHHLMSVDSHFPTLTAETDIQQEEPNDESI
ncbi:TagK domain-containing protein [Burkholderia thailandensis]|nr:TagK domain-containing protein [Burkholderia thailandensis]MDD1490002.1 TagK domain-containing protein [Burkholderia thailandensis]MDD1495929.1 TagK domain-containing protein [Burkholderia thailandensis]